MLKVLTLIYNFNYTWKCINFKTLSLAFVVEVVSRLNKFKFDSHNRLSSTVLVLISFFNYLLVACENSTCKEVVFVSSVLNFEPIKLSSAKYIELEW